MSTSPILTRMPPDTVALERRCRFWMRVLVAQVLIMSGVLVVALAGATQAERPKAYLTTYAGHVIPISAGVELK